MYYPFVVNLNRCMGRCNSLNDLFNKVCVPNTTKDLNLSAFNMTAGINESKIFKVIINKVSDNLFETLLHLIALLNLEFILRLVSPCPTAGYLATIFSLHRHSCVKCTHDS